MVSESNNLQTLFQQLCKCHQNSPTSLQKWKFKKIDSRKSEFLTLALLV